MSSRVTAGDPAGSRAGFLPRRVNGGHSFSRRDFLRAAAAGTLSGMVFGGAPAVAADVHPVRLALTARSMDQCLAWIGIEAHIFSSPALQLASSAGGSAEALGKLLAGECEFAHLGLETLLRGVLEGADPVLVLSPVDVHRAGSIMALHAIRSPDHLAGTRVGVVTEGGVSAASARMILQSFGVSATLVPLGSAQAVYAALQAERIDAGYLPVELGLHGRGEFGWNMFEGGAPGVSGGIVTTRRFIASNRESVAGIVRGFVDAIHFIKTRSGDARRMLERYLVPSNPASIGRIYDYYAPIFRAVPVPSAFFAAVGLRDALAGRYPGARRIASADYIDSSFVDELHRGGYIERLYAA